VLTHVVVSLNVIAHLAGPPQSGLPAPQVADQPGPALEELFHRKVLEDCKGFQTKLEFQIQWFENQRPHLRDSPDLGHQVEDTISDLKIILSFTKKRVVILEWYQQQRRLKPGLATDLAAKARLEVLDEELTATREGRVAPMPREVKR
jgi:hypothetical protein